MEIEMKARVNREQIDKLLWYFNNESEYLEKSDEYFSFNGAVLDKPKNIIRIRKEVSANAFNTLYEEGGESNGFNPSNIALTLENMIRPFDSDTLEKESKTWLTIKAKNTNSDGVETNEECEGQLNEKSEEAFRKSMEVANFKTYFKKIKRSFSFYVKNEEEDKNKFEMHAELVSVNNIGPYLEIESIVKEKDASEASDQIKWFFGSTLGIITFDERSWPEIIG